MDVQRRPGDARRLTFGLRILVAVCLALIPWIGYLALTLPVHYVADQWRFAWVGFDIVLLSTLAATAWFGWRRRQVVIPLAIATAVLLICDAWFDVTLARGSRDFWTSLAFALLVELPLAGYLLLRARRLLRATFRASWIRAGLPGEPPPLHRVPLFVVGTRREREEPPRQPGAATPPEPGPPER
ncbi:hypothetical protein [Peterkaempfera bronchialis]|uniref:Uncharacterized protein n=1 Tax=Peterkaempfera bronchialis TaxID=2126346 RepID=A0A345STL2_9ACTN|nr:hypothetical protein [Peterkaempfera bronchialis]AXI77067.1 hypothetical protein C7M71_006005 [Peterkaempfera bronchialis]